MNDFINLNDDNPWDLKELEYNGELFHYTNEEGQNGIFYHNDCPNYPEGCISLRFKRIDCMTKNDSNERKHIDNAVKKIAMQLLDKKKITREFQERLHEYIPSNKGFFMLALDKIDDQFYGSPHRRLLDFGPMDYFVACFSINPNNKYIVREFKTPIRIAFNADFSQMYNNPFSIYPYPQQSLRKCSFPTYMRRVEYIDTFIDGDYIKSDFIENKILDIFTHYQETKEEKAIEWDLEDMYSLCDAFVKDSKYKQEEEVRFVIRFPQRSFFLEKYRCFPKWLADNYFVFDEKWTYLQIPISKNFVTSIDDISCNEDR